MTQLVWNLKVKPPKWTVDAKSGKEALKFIGVGFEKVTKNLLPMYGYEWKLMNQCQDLKLENWKLKNKLEITIEENENKIADMEESFQKKIWDLEQSFETKLDKLRSDVNWDIEQLSGRINNISDDVKHLK